MSLQPGVRLGSYEIVEHIGAGGMGDVYRARDTRLDRTGALKVVRTDYGERFEREAKAISALNHPHICALTTWGLCPLAKRTGRVQFPGHGVRGRPSVGWAPAGG